MARLLRLFAIPPAGCTFAKSRLARGSNRAPGNLIWARPERRFSMAYESAGESVQGNLLPLGKTHPDAKSLMPTASVHGFCCVIGSPGTDFSPLDGPLRLNYRIFPIVGKLRGQVRIN